MSTCGATLEVLNIDACTETNSRYYDPCSERATHSQSQYHFMLNFKKGEIFVFLQIIVVSI